MATRPAFYVDFGTETIRSRESHFEWYPGFSEKQKQRCIASWHNALAPSNALEISTKSQIVLGRSLSAFNLKLYGIPLECVFQGSKVYRFGGPFHELLYCRPKDAKRDPRHRSSGSLTGFEWEKVSWPTSPRTAFYDFIYLQAVKQNFSIEDLEELITYRYFTDIEFNPKKSINCQARTVALLKLLLQKYGEIPQMTQHEWLEFHAFTVKA